VDVFFWGGFGGKCAKILTTRCRIDACPGQRRLYCCSHPHQKSYCDSEACLSADLSPQHRWLRNSMMRMHCGVRQVSNEAPGVWVFQVRHDGAGVPQVWRFSHPILPPSTLSWKIPERRGCAWTWHELTQNHTEQ
jgi:hypothetical protein